jgi:ketosteroid isomerase-like protein/quercetin dioxygenase-like cupin family protein
MSLVVVGVVASSCAQSVNVQQEKTALMARDAEWSKTAGDPAKFTSFFAPDGVFALAGMPALTSAKAIEDFATGMNKAGAKISWTATRADVASSGDLGYTAGTYQITVNNADGRPTTEKGKYLTTWKKINGEWKVTEDTGNDDAPPNPSSPHVVTPVASIKWMDAPPFLPKGAKLAVLVGDPSQPAPFTIRLQMPDGYKIAPHTHPTDEHVTVMSGTFRAAMGEKWDDKALGDFAAGSYANMAAGMPHYAAAKGATVVQVHGVGPFVVNYINPADDPSKK